MCDNNVNESHGYTYGSGYGVDAVFNLSIPKEDHPFCSHGPTILFERFFKDKEPRKFFACSACRNRKECTFFQWYDEKVTAGKKLIQQETKKKIFKKRKKEIQILVEDDYWCFDCACGYLADNEDKHNTHTTKVLSKKEIQFPTQFLNPSESKKAKAQYYFDDETCQFFLTTIKRLQYKNVICLGTPRLFEHLYGIDGMSVILLDIDTRFEYFYSPKDFLVYNMYTHFFFDKGSRKKIFETFVSKCLPEETLIILDPPFGGLLNVLEKTISKIWNLFGVESIPTMMVFPYFLENHVGQNLQSLLMHDYKVSYSNHPTYHNADKQVRGSPVRIYTNISGEKLSLPKEDYRFCKTCQRYVYKANRHCKECNACTSKDGRTYVHCIECKKCVKPGDVHCSSCESCKPLKHVCGNKNVMGCHICGNLDHKRRDCPRKLLLGVCMKRKRSLSKGINDKKKRRKSLKEQNI